MTVWLDRDSETLLTGWSNPSDAPLSVYGVSATSGAVTQYDWAGNGGEKTIAVAGRNITFYESGSYDYDDGGDTSGFPASGEVTIGTVYFKVWDKSGPPSAEASCDIILDGSLGVDTGGPVFTSLNPPELTPNAVVTTNVTAYFDRAISAGTGIVKLKVVGGADIQSWTLPGDIGSGISISGNALIMDPTASLANSTNVALYIAAGAVKDAGNYGVAALTDDSVYFTTEAAAPPSSQPLPPPTFDTWYFNDVAVGAWNTSTNCATWAEVVTAIQTAMADPGTVGVPKYHDIIYTGAALSGNQTISFTQALPTEDSVFIRVRPSTPYQTITGKVTVSSGASDVLWTGWQFQPDNTTHNGGALTQCFRLGVSGRRFAFRDCRFGLHWRGISTPGDYPEAIGGSVANNKIRLVDCVGIRLHQVIDGRAGYYHMENCLWLQLLDDNLAMTVRGASPNVCGGYVARCIIGDPVDDPAYSGLHCDFGLQTGETSDLSTDTYYPEMHQTIVLAGTYRQYPTHGFFAQKGGPATNFLTSVSDCVFAVTGWRAIELPDKRTVVKRIMGVWPPTAGPIPNTGTGWTGGPPKPEFWLNANTAPGSGATPIIEDLIVSKLDDRAGWGITPGGKTLYVSPTTAHGSTPSYGTVFLSMAGMSYSGGQTRIDPVTSGYRAAIDSFNMTTIRQWVSDSYEPTSVAHGTGWTQNGLTDPVTWTP